MALLEGQVQVRDLVMGPGSDFIVVDFNPWVRNARVDQAGSRAWNHGSWSGAEWAEEIVVPLVVAPQADSGFDTASWLALHQQLAAAFRPIGDATEDVEMRFRYGGKEYLMRGRPRMVEPEVENIRTGAVVSRCAFVAQDPFIYAGEPLAFGPFGLPEFSGGLTVPFTAPFTVDGALTAGFADLANEGTVDTGLVLRIDGPAPFPYVTLKRADGIVQTLHIDVVLGEGDWLDIDTDPDRRTVLLNGTANFRGRVAGDWPILPPGGPSRLRWSAAEHSTGTLSGTAPIRWW